MAGIGYTEGFEGTRESECSFVWDESSKLYFHASSGFYHDPNAGWYYSSWDGHYYKFENGTYVPLTSDKDEESEPQECTTLSHSEPVKDEKCNEDSFTGDELENQRLPSEWLEETLINFYLSGHSGLVVGAEDSTTLQCNEEERSQVSCGGLDDQFASDKLPASHQVEQVEEQWAPEDVPDAELLTAVSSGKDASLDEEKWQAQYGQVLRVADECVPDFPVIDLWDWEMVVETVKKRHKVARLFGRLVRRFSKLHPSVPCRGGLLKTASIRDVHLDLVRVASEKVYRLRTPNKRYLASLLEYDSSNPTKDWGFPDLFVNMQNVVSLGFNQACETNSSSALTRKRSSSAQDEAFAFQKHFNLPYRDRAAERRALHGEFSIGPGQKNFLGSNSYEEESTSQTFDPEEAAAEAMNMTFGKGSYARRVLEKMGWKDGEALGSSTKGILEPLQAVANKGYAGLGWNHIN